ncbi:MAG: uroporphyrinogen-III synthase [Betaproteobacteria bacterium]
MSLAGRRVLVTRPRELAPGLARRIEDAGGRAVLFPAIEIEPLPPSGTVERYDVVVFVSPTAVARGARWIGAGARTFAVGAGTAKELMKLLPEVAFPSVGADSESLLALPELADAAGKRILIVRGEGGRALLGETLSRRGGKVEYAECYRRVRPRADAAPLLAEWVDAVTVSSGEALHNLLELLGEAGRRRLRGTPLFVPHARVAAQAAAAGLGEIVLAGAGDDEMIERLVAYFSR